MVQVITEREEKYAIAIASNEPFSGRQDLYRPGGTVSVHGRPTAVLPAIDSQQVEPAPSRWAGSSAQPAVAGGTEGFRTYFGD